MRPHRAHRLPLPGRHRFPIRSGTNVMMIGKIAINTMPATMIHTYSHAARKMSDIDKVGVALLKANKV